MGYKSLKKCVSDLNNHNQINFINKEVDPDLEMATIHLEEFSNNKKVLFFNNIKDCSYTAVSNIFGTLERSRFLFRDSIDLVKDLISIKINPIVAFKNPFKTLKVAINAFYALPKKVRFKNFHEIKIEDLPQVKCWKNDGGAFVTLPQVYSEDLDNPGILNSNLGMYRIQLSAMIIL